MEISSVIFLSVFLFTYVDYMETKVNLNAERTLFAVKREMSGCRNWECSLLHVAGKGVPLRQETSRQISTGIREVG